MRRITTRGVMVMTWLVAAATSARAGESWRRLVEELLDMPAPAADWRPHAPYSASPPPDDAPLEVLAAWWGEDHHGALEDLSPSDAVRQRLLEAVKEHPPDLARLVRWLPESAEARSLVERLKSEHADRMEDYWEEIVSGWLDRVEVRSDDELFEEARNARYRAGYVEGGLALRAIAGRDRTRARSVLGQLRRGDDTRVAALALGLLYEDSLRHDSGSTEEERVALRGIAADRSQPPFARNLATEALVATRWPGRDEWFLQLFSDESLRTQSEDSRLYRPLAAGVASDPDELVPKVASLVGSDDRTAHDNAVACLAQFRLRVDALRPLVPWLRDPSWSSGARRLSSDRLRFIQSLDRVRIPEAIPGLIEVLRRERHHERRAAAQALTFHRDHRAVPVLKAVLDEETDEGQRRFLLQALAACGGVGEDEQAAALEAYARQVSTDEGRSEWNRARRAHGQGPTIDPRISLGWFLRDGNRADDALAERLYARADALAESEPGTSRTLLRLLARWPQVAVATRVVEAIGNGSADVESLTAALKQRDVIAANAGDALRKLSEAGGSASGVASVLRGDPAIRERILLGADREAQAALLACARLTRTPLPIAAVGSILEVDDALLGRAAEAYLVSEDSPAARELVLARHPGEMVILGARSDHDPGHFSFHDLGAWGQRLVAEMRGEDAPDEIFALLSAGYWGDAGQTILYVRGDRTDLLQRLDESRYRQRVLGSGEWNDLRRFIEQSRFFDLPPLTTDVWDGLQCEALHLTRSGGRRVFMNNPGDDGSAGSAYHLLVRRFQRMAALPTTPVRYDLFDVMPEARHALSGQKVLAVGGTSGNLAVLIDDDESPAWRRLEGSELGNPVPRPSGWPDEELGAMNKALMLHPRLNPSPWQARLGEGVVLAGLLKERSGYSPALRWCKIAGGSEILAEGSYASPIVTPDGSWLLAAKAGRRGWSQPNTVVRVRLSDREELPIELPAADTLKPVGWVGEREREAVLLYRARQDESESGFYLCDPETGATRPVDGEFRPWFDVEDRPLQPTGNVGEAWAAIPERDQTRLGRYRTGDFTFLPVATYPRLAFNSAALWVDEKGQTVYVAHRGDLLALPLAPSER